MATSTRIWRARLCIIRSTALAELKDTRGSVAVRRELLERYGHTYFAGRMSAGTTSEAPKEN